MSNEKTIGDEKVVQRWTPEICEDEQDGQIVAGMDPYTEGHYVLHSAYAELAAERDSFRDELSRWVHMLADKRAELQAAESQLAELRGRCEALSTDISEAVEDVARSGGYINSDEAKGWSVELRTLAAADSSLQSRDGG